MEHEELLSWAGAAEQIGNELAVRNRYRAVFASGPPWSTVIAASRLASTHSLELFLDFRDPWSLPLPRLVEKTAHPLGRLLGNRLESAAVRPARAVIANTPNVERAMRLEYPGVLFRTIVNGVDDAFIAPPAKSSAPFRIVYAGTIYLDRDPTVLFNAIGRMVRELHLTPQDLSVEFIGEVGHLNRFPTERMAEAAGISACFRSFDPMPREELLSTLSGADVLVSLPQSTPWSIPSKIYEYMAFDALMLVYATRESATAEILTGSDAVVLEPLDGAGTFAALRKCYEQHRAGIRPSHSRDRERFARSKRGEELLELLADVGLTADPHS